ncbi:MAG TPA: helix-turn-helix domain-containing protein [Woeseiaceae bacterium]|nr:helix-turn-helix domain-containing protein [Woeseiaceae bacterium]
MTSTKREYSIGELAARTGVNKETIRYYEKAGVMPDPPRTSSGYRMYGPEHLDRLRFIRRCRQLGFSMANIGSLLELVDDHDYSCAEVKSLTLTQADAVSAKIRDLERLEKTLRKVASRCTGRNVPDCPVIDALLDPDDQLELRDNDRIRG